MWEERGQSNTGAIFLCAAVAKTASNRTINQTLEMFNGLRRCSHKVDVGRDIKSFWYLEKLQRLTDVVDGLNGSGEILTCNHDTLKREERVHL